MEKGFNVCSRCYWSCEHENSGSSATGTRHTYACAQCWSTSSEGSSDVCAYFDPIDPEWPDELGLQDVDGVWYTVTEAHEILLSEGVD